jgi:hypothetical protein
MGKSAKIDSLFRREEAEKVAGTWQTFGFEK